MDSIENKLVYLRRVKDAAIWACPYWFGGTLILLACAVRYFIGYIDISSSFCIDFVIGGAFASSAVGATQIFKLKHLSFFIKAVLAALYFVIGAICAGILGYISLLVLAPL